MDKIMRTLIQRQRFIKLSPKFSQVYQELLALGKQPFIMPFWNSVNESIEREFLPKPPLDFLATRSIKDTMFVQPSQQWINEQLDFLKTRTGNQLGALAREDIIGRPELFENDGLKSSHNTIHHLYHIFRFSNDTNQSIENVKSIVEWGGGYGNFAKLWKRLDKNATFTIIDTALFCTIQWLYLSCVLGPDAANLLKTKSDKLVNGKINIIPLALIEKAPKKCDLFVSTWGLSESATTAQDYVINKKWFGAKHLLIGFQDSTAELKHASRLGKLAAKAGADIKDITFIPHNHYAFK